MFDNPTGVMTNAPPFDWHLAHLGMYLDLSVTEPRPLTLGTLTLSPPSSGAGSVGLPGDMTSPSRFLRAFLFSHSAPKGPTKADAVGLAFHILNNFDIVPGTIRTSADATAGGGVNGTEITEWSVVADLKARQYTSAPSMICRRGRWTWTRPASTERRSAPSRSASRSPR